MMNYKSKWALITGASSGIGETFARKLAGRGANVILVARRTDKLQELAHIITRDFPSDIHLITQDLSLPNAAQTLFDAVAKLGCDIDILVNNAGIGAFGPLAESDIATNRQMLNLNILTLSELTRLYLPSMIARKSGHIYNIASTAAFQPLSYFANYAATKAFVLSFSEAVAMEADPHGVRVLAVCPGATASEFFTRANIEKPHLTFDTTDTVVRDALTAMEKGKITVVCGNWKNTALTLMHRFFPRYLTALIGKLVMERSMGK